MSALRSALAIGVYSALDGALGLQLLTKVPAVRTLLAILVGHLAVSVLVGLALPGAMPRFVRVTRREIVGCGALIAGSIPVLGSLGMLITIRFGLIAPREQSGEPWVVLDLEKDVERQQRHPLRARRAAVSAVEIRDALKERSEATVAQRFQSVLAIQKLPPRVGVPLLKIAQSDPSDEIRLYAFSRLERMRDNLEKQVKAVTSALSELVSCNSHGLGAAASPGAEAARLHLRLAQSYWELGYLGLAEGAVLAHAMKSAHHHAAIASEQSPMHAPAEFFLGRILLHFREPERATTAFERAIRAGYPRIKALPWLAECAFYERDFGSVTALLRELDSLSPENVFFQPVSDFWADRQANLTPPRGSRESLRIGSKNKLQRRRSLT